MAVRVEPPGKRPRPNDSANYPGLTLSEGGLTDFTGTETPPPLWVIPSDVPSTSRSVGFIGALPEPPAPTTPEPPEGLFDVPGLLERLWLARALEAHRDKPAPVLDREPEPPPRREEAPTLPTSRSAAVSDPLSPAARARRELPSPPVATVFPAFAPEPSAAAAEPPVRPVPTRRGWVCPACYLTNDPQAAGCRGCGNPAPRI